MSVSDKVHGNKGRKKSEETRRKIGEAAKARKNRRNFEKIEKAKFWSIQKRK
tara:strand:+ start:88 stop:243 length:156 start_codon:yes stop_codon:yes gene_type:complete